jgi:sulfite exporter TauE/SafE
MGAHALYALGRVAAYAMFGAVAGASGATLTGLLGLGVAADVQIGVRVLVGLLLIGLGLGLAGFRVFRRLERFGLSLWRRLQPLSRRAMRLPGPLRALALGALWGFLPCAMVYGALLAAAATLTAVQGALFMLAFGLGTAPAVLTLGMFATGLGSRLGQQNLRRGSALAVVVCGVWTLLGSGVLRSLSHVHH